jgi:hypothetical protein
MKSHNPRLERLKELLSLEERRVAVQQELDTITERMSSLRDSLFDEGASVARAVTSPSPAKQNGSNPTAGRKARATGKRGKRGQLKEQILGALSSAGEAGVKVTELAKALSIKPVNIHSWFHSSLKRFPEIKKLKGGHYRLEGELKSEQQASGVDEESSPRTSATKPTGRKGRGPARNSGAGKESSSGTRRGALSEQVLSELEKAGAKGASVRDIAERIGANYRNIYIWFATTGKKNPKIKKIAPAQYRLG